jgi:quinoprotein dehydrogenase-associated probable ABC transporter substrate-binding protein
MSLASSLALWLAAVASVAAAPAAPPLRVCADPNNMPFSNAHRDGFENRIAALVARDLGRPLVYVWAPQRRGFVRNTLDAGRCDVVVGVPAGFGRLRTTRPYYRSSYVFVSRRDRHLRLASFDDPRLKALTIGIQVTGDDYNNPPAAQALASRGLVDQVRGYPVYGDYSRPDPQRGLIDDVARGRIDVAVVWGPQGGYYAGQQPVPLEVTPVRENRPAMPFEFAIAMGVRRDDVALSHAVDQALVRHASEIRRILSAYGVPLT